MPRSRRLDIPDLLQHVIVRGIERRDIFLEDADREDFVRRLSSLAQETETDCLAWSLMSNHFHLLLRPRKVTLGTVMKRLLTGYAVAFNLRHERSGHLFQNRFKSIVCDEDTYLLELVRYIHLNPLRAGIVSSLSELDSYSWCGHAVILGKRELAGQAVPEVLGLFGRKTAVARERYSSFIADGDVMGRRKDLVGQRDRKAASTAETRMNFDSRILGDDEFAEALRSHGNLAPKIPLKVPVSDIIAAVAAQLSVAAGAVTTNSRSPAISKARAVVCYIACSMGHTGAMVGSILGLTSAGVCAARARGKTIVESGEVAVVRFAMLDNSTSYILQNQ
jgi:REP element-mobilizing transposase RayT